MKISISECGKAAASDTLGKNQEKILPDNMPRKKAAGRAKEYVTPLEHGLAVAEEALKLVPDTRDELVEELRKRIESGDYEISGEEVADMMMRRRAADRLR